MYQNKDSKAMKNKIDINPRDTSNDRKKYNLSPSEF